ncbi:MAG: ABC transporter permease [Caldilineaceae bacterium]|nr:ABC transporter permease [Caldilineaceae bacterium]
MTKYIIQRVIVSIPIFFGITMIVFALYALAPGDPLAMLLGERAMLEMTAEELEAARESLGLNDPWWGRYISWLSRAIRGDLGYPLTGGYTVMELLQQRIGPTLLLMATAFAVSLLAGVPMGIVMALKQYSWIDYLVTVLAFAQLSIPSFFLALGAMYVFSLKLDIFPTSGLQTIGEPFSLWDRIHHLIMPSFILAAYFAGVWARYTRSSMLETMHLEFVTTARAKGLRERVVVVRHALRNALLPMITVASLSLGQLLGGSIIIETIFQWPGLGMLGWQATLNREYPILMGIILIASTMVLASNLLADILYAVADPRIRYD